MKNKNTIYWIIGGITVLGLVGGIIYLVKRNGISGKKKWNRKIIVINKKKK
jgi:hypothetical protein